MDFGDSPEEAEFRLRLRAWLATHNPGPARLVDRRRVLGRPGGVAPCALRRRLLRRHLAEGDRRPGPAERLRRHRRRGAGGRRRAAPARASATWWRGSSSTAATTSGPLPPRHRQRARPVVPGLQRARCRLRPGLAAHPGRPGRRRVRASPGTRCGRATPTTPTGAWSWPVPITRLPSTRASRPSPCRWASPASSSGPCA